MVDERLHREYGLLPVGEKNNIHNYKDFNKSLLCEHEAESTSRTWKACDFTVKIGYSLLARRNNSMYKLRCIIYCCHCENAAKAMIDYRLRHYITVIGEGGGRVGVEVVSANLR